MRAATIVAKKQLRVAELESPKAGPGEVVVRQVGSSVNPVDLETADGSNHMLLAVQAPFAAGVDVAGVVEEVGPGVSELAGGDRVVAFTGVPRPGAFAEQVTVPASTCARLPAAVSFRRAAGLPLAGLCALQGLERAGLTEGKRVLVHGGAGAVGSMAVQIASGRGAHVISTARAAHHEKLQARGAQQVIDYTTSRFDEDLRDIDIVFDVAGGDTLKRSWKVLKPGGTLVSVRAMPSPDDLRQAGFRVPAPIAFVAKLAGAWAQRGGNKVGARLLPLVTVPDGRGLEKLVQAVAAGRLSYDVDRVFPLQEVEQALAHARGGRARGRVLVELGEPGSLAA